MIFFEYFNDKESRDQMEVKIRDIYSKKKTFNINDIYLMRELALNGG